MVWLVAPGPPLSTPRTDPLQTVFSKCSPAMEDGKRYENMVSPPKAVPRPAPPAMQPLTAPGLAPLVERDLLLPARAHCALALVL